MKRVIDIEKTYYEIIKHEVINGNDYKSFEIIANSMPYEERSQGEWILKETNYDDGGNNFYECSNCHYSDIHAESADVPFCWHCGAYMGGDENNGK